MIYLQIEEVGNQFNKINRKSYRKSYRLFEHVRCFTPYNVTLYEFLHGKSKYKTDGETIQRCCFWCLNICQSFP